MKYQNFNRSCSYTGLANMLVEHGIDTEDKEIILEANIPYIFRYSNEQQKYLAGPMLQSKKWFDYYLNNYGLEYCEGYFSGDDAIAFFDAINHSCMVGLKMGNSSKHAVIFQGKDNNKYRFLNIKPISSQAPDFYLFSKNALDNLLENESVVGWIKRIPKKIDVNTLQEIILTTEIIRNYKEKIFSFISSEKSIADLKDSKVNIFEALLLDLVSMLEIIAQNNLAERIIEIRKQYQNAMEMNKRLRLSDYLPVKELDLVFNDYMDIVENKISIYRIQHAQKIFRD